MMVRVRIQPIPAKHPKRSGGGGGWGAAAPMMIKKVMIQYGPSMMIEKMMTQLKARGGWGVAAPPMMIGKVMLQFGAGGGVFNCLRLALALGCLFFRIGLPLTEPLAGLDNLTLQLTIGLSNPNRHLIYKALDLGSATLKEPRRGSNTKKKIVGVREPNGELIQGSNGPTHPRLGNQPSLTHSRPTSQASTRSTEDKGSIVVE